MPRKVLARNLFPIRAPLALTIATVTAVSHFDAPDWLAVMLGIFLGFLWALWIWELLTEDERTPLL